MKFKIKGANRIGTIENASFLLMGFGVLLMIVGFSLSVSAGNVLAGTAAILGSFLFFASLVALLLALFVKEVTTSHQKVNRNRFTIQLARICFFQV